MYQWETPEHGVVARSSKAACGALLLGFVSVSLFSAGCVLLGLYTGGRTTPQDKNLLSVEKKRKIYLGIGVFVLLLSLVLGALTVYLAKLYFKKAARYNPTSTEQRANQIDHRRLVSGGSAPALTSYTPDIPDETGAPPTYLWTIQHQTTTTNNTNNTNTNTTIVPPERDVADPERDSGYPMEEHPEYPESNPAPLGPGHNVDLEHPEQLPVEQRVEPSAPPEPPPSYNDLPAGNLA